MDDESDEDELDTANGTEVVEEDISSTEDGVEPAAEET